MASNFFDTLLARGANNIAPTSHPATYGANVPPQVQPIPMVQQAPKPNPFDQFDAPAASAPAPLPQAALHSPVPPASEPAPVISNTAPQAHDWNAGTMTLDGGQDTTLATDPAQAAKQLQADVAMIINNGGSREDIAARLAKDNLRLDQTKGLDDALAWRETHAGVIPVGIMAAADKPEYHGEDKGGLEAFRQGAADAVAIGGKDEFKGFIEALGNSIEGAFGGGTGETFAEHYARIRDEERQKLEDARFYRPGTTLVGGVVGSLATLPIGGEATLGRIAMEGAGLGGAYAFNSADGDLKQRAIDGLKGAAIGGLGGVAIGGPLNAMSNRIAANRANPSEAREILNAADRLNANAAQGEEIRPLLGHTSNGGLGTMVHALAQPTLTAGRLGGLDRATRAFEEAAGAARNRIADDAAGGMARDINAVAQSANDAGNAGSLAAYREQSRQGATAAYNNAEQLAGSTRVQTPRTIQAIDAKLAEWREVPGGVAGMHRLEELRETLANGTWTVPGLRRLRTSFGDGIDSGNRTVREAANALWPTLSQDISGGLRQAGRDDAARAYRLADRDYAQRISNLDMIDRVIGRDANLSADQVAAKLTSMSKTEYNKLGQAMAAIDPAQAGDIRGGLIRTLGRANPAHQNAAGDAFSLQTFATGWAKMSNQAKNAMFGAQTVRDLNDLATLAGSNRRMTMLGNSSRSGIFAQNYREAAKGAEVTAAWFAGVANPSTLTAIGGSAVLGRILAAPGVARAIVAGSEFRPIEVVARRLSEAARRNPALAQQILGLRDTITGQSAHAVTIEQTGGQPAAGMPPAAMDGVNPFDQFDEPNG